MPHIVLKPIPTNDDVIPVGTVVDASGWRNCRSLISARYLAVIPDEFVPAVEPARERRKPGPKPKNTPTVTDEDEDDNVDQ